MYIVTAITWFLLLKVSLFFVTVQVEEVFEWFSPEPLGTASLAQVHRALTRDGREMAVKIQHPHVKAHSYVDIRTMEVRIHKLTVSK